MALHSRPKKTQGVVSLKHQQRWERLMYRSGCKTQPETEKHHPKKTKNLRGF